MMSYENGGYMKNLTQIMKHTSKSFNHIIKCCDFQIVTVKSSTENIICCFNMLTGGHCIEVSLCSAQYSAFTNNHSLRKNAQYNSWVAHKIIDTKQNTRALYKCV